MSHWDDAINSNRMVGVMWPDKVTFSFLSGVDVNRFRRSRSRGWKMPIEAVYVGRPGKYSNPFRLFGDIIWGNASYRRKILDPWVIVEEDVPTEEYGRKRVLELYREWLQTEVGKPNKWFVNPVSFTYEELVADLKGKNLVCWCKLDQECHADILISLANH